MTRVEQTNIFSYVVIDGFTKFVRLYPTKTTSTKEPIKALVDYCRSYLIPRFIVSDRESCFISNEFEEFVKENEIKHVKMATGLMVK